MRVDEHSSLLPLRNDNTHHSRGSVHENRRREEETLTGFARESTQPLKLINRLNQ